MAEKVVLQSASGAKIKIKGKNYLYFGGTNYLAMSGRKEVAEGAKKAIEKFGLSSSASRTTTGTNELHLLLEEKIALFAGTEKAAVLSSGYLSMRALLESTVEPDDLILLQHDAHQSILDAVKLTGLETIQFNLADNSVLNDTIEQAKGADKRILVVGEGVGPLNGRIFPLPIMMEKLSGANYKILLDDAHGFAVLGERARGAAEYFGIDSERVRTCGTLSKALGAFGGCIFGSAELVGRLHDRGSSFICASQPSAADLGAAAASLDYIEKNPGIIVKLKENALRLRQGLRNLGIETENTPVPVIPIMSIEGFDLVKVSDKLFERGYLAPYLNYPGSPDGGMIRMAVCADHINMQIDSLLNELSDILFRK